MEKKSEENIFMVDDPQDTLWDYEELAKADYQKYNLSALAEKIKLQTYRPKPKMLYL